MEQGKLSPDGLLHLTLDSAPTNPSSCELSGSRAGRQGAHSG